MLRLWVCLDEVEDPDKLEKVIDLIKKAGAEVVGEVTITHPSAGGVATMEINVDLAKVDEIRKKIPGWALKMIGI